MTSAERQELHIQILDTLRTKAELGLPERTLVNTLRTQGVALDLAVLHAELQALADAALIASWQESLQPKRWMITAKGEQTLARAGV